jgi:hypothetical protein
MGKWIAGSEQTFAALFGGEWVEKLVPVFAERPPCARIKRKLAIKGLSLKLRI